MKDLLSDVQILLIYLLWADRMIGSKYIPIERLGRKAPPEHRGEVASALNQLRKSLIVAKHKKNAWSLTIELGTRIARALSEQGEFERVSTRRQMDFAPVYRIFVPGSSKGRFKILSVEPTRDPDIPLFGREMFRQKVTISFTCPHLGCGSPDSVFSFQVGAKDCYSEEMDVWCSVCRLPAYHCLKDLTLLAVWSLEEAEAIRRASERLRTSYRSGARREDT